MKKPTFPAPFDGAITRYLQTGAPASVRDAVMNATDGKLLSPDYPYAKRMKSKAYKAQFDTLQIELAKMQAWAQTSGARIAVILEGRDAAGKGGTIKRFMENLNPRNARIVALTKPTEVERGQWYFQRYIQHLPSAGEIVFFDRSWYNRGVIEHVFGFCDKAQRTAFFDQVPRFEAMLIEDGILLFKIWLTVGRAEQLQRFLAREADPLKHWKLSSIDVKGLPKWDDYTSAIAENFAKSHSDNAPWTVIRSNDKKRARLAAMRAVLGGIDYTERTVDPPDPKVCGTPDQFDLI